MTNGFETFVAVQEPISALQWNGDEGTTQQIATIFLKDENPDEAIRIDRTIRADGTERVVMDIQSHMGNLLVHEHHWIVYDEQVGYFSMSDEEFRAKFQPAQGTENEDG